MRWRRVIYLGLVAAACGGGAAVLDTNCESPAIAAAEARFASTVLLGTVTDWDGSTARFQIEEIWRGVDLPEIVEITAAPGRTYAAGVRYLVFPTRGTPPLQDAPCTATTRWDESLAELRPLRPRTPGPSPAADPDLPWEWVIALAVAVGVGIVIQKVIDRRRHPAAVWDPDHRLDESARVDSGDSGGP